MCRMVLQRLPAGSVAARPATSCRRMLARPLFSSQPSREAQLAELEKVATGLRKQLEQGATPRDVSASSSGATRRNGLAALHMLDCTFRHMPPLVNDLMQALPHLKPGRLHPLRPRMCRASRCLRWASRPITRPSRRLAARWWWWTASRTGAEAHGCDLGRAAAEPAACDCASAASLCPLPSLSVVVPPHPATGVAPAR